MGYLIDAGQEATAQSAVTIITVGATQRVRIVAVHLSVPAGQTATLKVGSNVKFATDTSLNLDLSFGKYFGAPGEDVILDSSGGVSWSVVHNLEEV